MTTVAFCLSRRQVKIWFQNRRAKERKQNKKREEGLNRANASGVPKLEPLDSPPPITAQHPPHGHAPSPNMGMNMNQHHMLSQSGSGANGGLSLPASSNSHPHPHPHPHHLPSPMPQQRYQPHRLSPASSGQGMVHDSLSLPQTATPTGSAAQLSDPASVSCSVGSHQSQSVATPVFEEKREAA